MRAIQGNWPVVMVVRGEHSKVCTKTIEGQYSSVKLEQVRLVVHYMALGPNFFIFNFRAFATKNTRYTHLTIQVETVHMANYGPSMNQSEPSDLPQE